MTTRFGSRSPPVAPRCSPRRVARARLTALVLAVGLAAASTACSTARQRAAPEGPTSLLHYRDAQTAAYFRHVYRSGNLYVDFRPALVVDAIAQDRTYRRLYVETLRQQLLLPPSEAERLHAEQAEAFETEIAILLFTYEGTAEPSRLTRANAPWRLFLRDDDGELTAPVSIQRIAEESPAYQYIDHYFRGLDRWSRMYLVTFPKLSKARLGQPVGPHPFELVVTGIKGTVTLRWEDPALFYAKGNGAG
jgi:hypothetical protein